MSIVMCLNGKAKKKKVFQYPFSDDGSYGDKQDPSEAGTMLLHQIFKDPLTHYWYKLLLA